MALTLLIFIALVTSGRAQTPAVGDGSEVPDSAAAQSDPPSTSFLARIQAFDRQLFRQIYSIDNGPFRSFVYLSDATAYRAFYGSVPVALVYTSLDGNGDWSDVYRLGLSELVTLGATLWLQKEFERDRPPYELAGTGVRVRSDDGDSVDEKTYSFPSGHAALAGALVTSWSLSYPKWYVIGPSAIWVSSIAISRVWRGRHFPGDVVGGILLGAAVASAIHVLDPLITPEFLKNDPSATPSAVRFVMVIPIR